MMGTSYKMEIYTKANIAIENHIYMLLMRVWGKLNNKLFPHLHFCFPLVFSVAFLVWYSSSPGHRYQEQVLLPEMDILLLSTSMVPESHLFLSQSLSFQQSSRISHWKMYQHLFCVTVFFKFATKFRMKNITNQVFSKRGTTVHNTYFWN